MAAESMAKADPKTIEAKFKTFLEASGGSPTDWDEQFLGFIRENCDGGLLTGKFAKDGHFVFSLKAAKGFWVMAGAEMRGKGFLQPKGITLLTEIAQEKRLGG